jgi:hypothetical protein
MGSRRQRSLVSRRTLYQYLRAASPADRPLTSPNTQGLAEEAFLSGSFARIFTGQSIWVTPTSTSLLARGVPAGGSAYDILLLNNVIHRDRDLG